MSIVIRTKTWDAPREQLRVRAFRRLALEYRYFNDLHFGGRLETPTLDLDDGPARYLCGAVRSHLFVPMSIAEEQPWRMVQECMIQQMVHQHILVDLGLRAGPAHAQEFRRFCEQPRLRLALAMTYGLPDFAGPTANPAEQRLLQRVQRLLALAESPNRHEAEAALQEAQRLMLKHNIDLSLCADPDRQRFGLRHLGRTLERVDEINVCLGWILQDHFFVKTLWPQTYDLQRDREGMVLEICGTRANVAMAVHVYQFMVAASERLWRDYLGPRDAGAVPGSREDFTAGIYDGVARKLEEQRRRSQVEGLIWLGDKALDEFYRELHPEMKPFEPTKVPMTLARLAGFRAGRQLELHRPLTAPRRADPATKRDERRIETRSTMEEMLRAIVEA